MRRLALLCCLLPLPLDGQTKSEPPFVPPPPPRSALMVQAPLLVENKKGEPVPADKASLTLSEDGTAQPILSLTPAAGQPLTFGLIVDTSPGQHATTAEIQAAAADFIRAMTSQLHTQGFVVHFDREVELLQDVTPDTDKLLKGASLIGTPEPSTAGDQNAHAQAMLYDALYLSTSEITGKQKGRKALVVFSGGMDQGSKETLRTAIDNAQQSGTIVYAVYVKGEQPKNNEDNRDQQRQQRRGGMGYPFPGGGYPGGGYPGSGYPNGGGYPSGNRQPRGQTPTPKNDGKRVLADIAVPTGGRIFELSKKQGAASIFSMIQDDIAHRSILTFNPDKRGAQPGFHSLRIVSTQKDTRADAPDGFYVQEPD